jgi:uncharacterized membrane protein
MKKLIILLFPLCITACQSSNKSEIVFENESKKVVRVIASKDSILTKMSNGVIVRQHQKEIVFDVNTLTEKPTNLYLFVYEYKPYSKNEVEDYIKRIDYDTQRLNQEDNKIVYRASENYKCEHSEKTRKNWIVAKK